MTPLERIITEKIRKEGALSFEKFMEMCLYCPGLGYYSSPGSVIGREGDFFTSPHLHPIFGAMIVKQLMEMWNILGRPSVFDAVEAGAGAGYLCKDIIDYLQRESDDTSFSREKNAFLEALRYIIVEPYQHFRELQRETLKSSLKGEFAVHHSGTDGNSSANKITWVEDLRALDGINGCIFSNELLDAFPVHLIETNDKLMEVYVDFDGKQFAEEKRPFLSDGIIDYIKRFDIDLPPEYRTEINLRIKGWLEEASSSLARGFILTVDYGYSTMEYYSEERSRGTLLCYHKHQYNENPYQHIGQQDITAHINFSSLKKWGDETGLATLGYCPQGTFLTASGIDEVIIDLFADSPDYLSEISRIKGLIMPQGMGESHSVMVQYKGEDMPVLRGFSMRNLADKL